MRRIRHVIFWAFVAGILNGILMAIQDYKKRKEMHDADQSSPS